MYCTDHYIDIFAGQLVVILYAVITPSASLSFISVDVCMEVPTNVTVMLNYALQYFIITS